MNLKIQFDSKMLYDTKIKYWTLEIRKEKNQHLIYMVGNLDEKLES
jgi:hypothetical protein